ncbi:Catalase [compost metagenome]
MAAWYDRNAEGENDHYTQPGNLFRLLVPEQQQNLISNVVGAMSGIEGPKRMEIINRQLCHWFRADPRLGMGIAQGLGVDIDPAMMK